MQHFNLLEDYPPPPLPREVGPQERTIHNKIRASYREAAYYDGERNDGYGGYRYDGRWVSFAHKIMQHYQLSNNAAILQLGCEKGFLLHDLKQHYPTLTLQGYEMSGYAIAQAMPSIKPTIQHGTYTHLPFTDHVFDCILAIGVVYTLTLHDAIACLKEIQRAGKGNSFITLAAYTTEEELRLFRWWTLLGSTILHQDEWIEVLKHVNYSGDYTFTTAKSLNLIMAPNIDR